MPCLPQGQRSYVCGILLFFSFFSSFRWWQELTDVGSDSPSQLDWLFATNSTEKTVWKMHKISKLRCTTSVDPPPGAHAACGARARTSAPLHARPEPFLRPVPPPVDTIRPSCPSESLPAGTRRHRAHPMAVTELTFHMPEAAREPRGRGATREICNPLDRHCDRPRDRPGAGGSCAPARPPRPATLAPQPLESAGTGPVQACSWASR